MSTTEKDNSKDSVVISNICANCGKEGGDVTNTCNKCKMVKYCNAACKKKHRSKHKKACDRRIAELHDRNSLRFHLKKIVKSASCVYQYLERGEKDIPVVER